MLTSQMCTRASLATGPLLEWAERLRPVWDPDGSGSCVLLHRKLWEWLFIAQALHERGVLRPGSRGLGFGVGQEPLVALFASMGCTVVATDQHGDAARAAGWSADGQFADDPSELNRHGLCDPDAFAARVTVRTVDMREVPPADLRDFDFSWSSCAFEHLGTLQAGMNFVVAQMECLRPAGVSVHTTELNVSSDEDTVDEGPTVLYRRRDLRRLAWSLRRRGHWVHLDFTPGDTPEDGHVDVPPYSDVHLRTLLEGYTTTSYGIVVRARGWWRPSRKGASTASAG